MIDPTKRTTSARRRIRASRVALCAAALVAAAPGGRAPLVRAPLVRAPGVHVALAQASAAPRIRIVAAGSRQLVLGRIDPGGAAAHDELTLVADSACDLRLRLTPMLPGTELAFSVRDGASGASTTCAAGPDGIAQTELDLPTEGERLDLVIRSDWGSSSYGLEIEARPRTATKSIVAQR